MPVAASVTYNANRLDPLYDFEDAITLPISIPPSTTIAKGTVLAQLASVVNEVQTLTITATGGTYTISYTDPISGVVKTTASLAYNANAAAIAAALNAAGVLGTSGVGVSGTYVITFSGTLYSGKPQNLLTVDTSLLTGGTATIARTTSGAGIGSGVAYSGAVVAAPSAPTVAGNGSGSSFGAGSYAVAITYVTANGETTPSPATLVTITAAQNLRVSAISSIPTTVTKVRYYVDSVLMAETVPSSGTAAQTDITGAALAVAGSPPTTNTAYTAPNGAGSSAPIGIMQYDVMSDALGNCFIGSVASSTWGESRKDVPYYIAGTFDTSKLVGLDANAIAAANWRLISGTTSAGVVRLG